MENPNVSPEASASMVSEKPTTNLKRFINFKIIVLVLAVLLLGALGYYYKSVFIAATVDGQPISRLAVIKELEKQSGREALDALISEKLLNNAAKKQGITVTEQEIEEHLKKVEDQITQQGGTLDEALSTQGITRNELRQQIELQVKAEKLIADKIQVTEEEVNEYIAGSGQTLEPGKEEAQKAEIREGLKQQKFSNEIATWLSEARANASINEFSNY